MKTKVASFSLVLLVNVSVLFYAKILLRMMPEINFFLEGKMPLLPENMKDAGFFFLTF